MTSLEALQSGPLQAAQIARLTGMEIEAVYAELVAAESLGLVRINVEASGPTRLERKTWEMMDDEPDNTTQAAPAWDRSTHHMPPPAAMNDIERIVREAGKAGMRCNAIAQARDMLMPGISRPLRFLIRDGRLAKLVMSHRNVVYFAPEFAPPAAFLNPPKPTPPKQKPGPKPKPMPKMVRPKVEKQRLTSIRDANTVLPPSEPIITAATKITRAEPFVDRRFAVETPTGWTGQITRDWREQRLQEARKESAT